MGLMRGILSGPCAGLVKRTFKSEETRKFTLVSLTTTGINIGASELLRWFGIDYRWAMLWGYVAQIAIETWANRKWTFRLNVAYQTLLMCTSAIEGLCYLISLGVMMVVYEGWGWYFFPARIIATMITGCISFGLTKVAVRMLKGRW
jgi:putative flippase GtrA